MSLRVAKVEEASALTDIQVRILADLDELRAEVLAHPDAACFSASLIFPTNDGTGDHITDCRWQCADHIPVETHAGILHRQIARLVAG